MALALVLNGYRFKVHHKSKNPELSINIKLTDSFYDTYECECPNKQLQQSRWYSVIETRLLVTGKRVKHKK